MSPKVTGISAITQNNVSINKKLGNFRSPLESMFLKDLSKFKTIIQIKQYLKVDNYDHYFRSVREMKLSEVSASFLYLV